MVLHTVLHGATYSSTWRGKKTLFKGFGREINQYNFACEISFHLSFENKNNIL